MSTPSPSEADPDPEDDDDAAAEPPESEPAHEVANSATSRSANETRVTSAYLQATPLVAPGLGTSCPDSTDARAEDWDDGARSGYAGAAR